MKAHKDTKLQHDVLAELEWEPSIDASQIGVAAKDGIVRLTGFVPSYSQKLAAERVTKRVYGVKAVADDIEVKLASSAERDDSDIAAAALHALKWETDVPDNRIKVTVRHGWLTIEGEMDWQFQKEAALRVVHNLKGIKGIRDYILLKQQPQPDDVKDKIEAAFKRIAAIDCRRISVEACGGKVILSGSVNTWAERHEAQLAAWAAPGVNAVENDIIVAP